MREQCDTEEDQVGLPGLEVFGESCAVRVLEKVQRLDEEEGRSKVDGKRDGNLAGEIAPATDPSHYATAPGGREGESLVVNTAGGGKDGRDFSERGTETQHEQTNGHPTPDHVRWTASGHGVGHGGRDGVRHGGHDEAHKHHLPC